MAGELIAATFGRGIWKTSLFSGCPFSIIHTDASILGLNQTGQQVHSASNHILSNKSFGGNPGTQLTYSAGSHTDLTPGFDIGAGTFFEVKVGDCPN